MTKILILRFSSIGDIVLTTPVVRAVKQQVPNAEVHYCTKPGFRILLENNPYIDKIHSLDGSLGELIRKLKAEKFDFVIDLHHNLRTQVIKLRLGVPSGSFDKLNFQKWLLVNLKINKMPEMHIVDRYLAAATKLGIKNDGFGLDYFISDKDKVDFSDFPLEFKNEYVAFAIGAQHATKKLPVSKIIELCRKVNRPIMLLGGKEDAVVGEEVMDAFKSETKAIVNNCGKYNLNGSAYLVQQSVLVITHDTGLMHIAAAFGKEVYSVWGNTVPEFGMYPYKTTSHIIEVKNLNCRPCSKIGFEKCPKGHFNCMNEQNFEGLNL